MIDIPPTPKQEASEDTTRKDDEKKAGFPPSVEASEGDSSENKLTSDAEQKPNAGALLWFEVLTTPTTDGDCSPSRDVKMQQPLHHGVGLQLAFDRCDRTIHSSPFKNLSMPFAASRTPPANRNLSTLFARVDHLVDCRNQ